MADPGKSMQAAQVLSGSNFVCAPLAAGKRGHSKTCTHLQFCTCSCKRPSRGGEGTSPKTWMTMT